jgi:hypothetical protein
MTTSEQAPLKLPVKSNTWLISVGFLVVAAGVLATYLLNQWSRDVPQRNLKSRPQPELAGRYQALELNEEWNKDSKAAAVKLAGKRVEVTGEVLQFQRHAELNPPQGDVVIGDRERDLASVVNCLFGDTEPWQLMAPHQTVTLVGQVWKLESGGFALTNCTVQSVSGESCPRLTADELATMLKSGEFARKYPWRSLFNTAPHVIVTGTIKDVRNSTYYRNDSSEVEVVLETAGEDEITCLFDDNAPQKATSDEVDSMITVVGERKGPQPENPTLQRCFRMRNPQASGKSLF